MSKEFYKARIRAVFSDAEVEWLRETGMAKRAIAARNEFGDHRGVATTASLFLPIMERAVNQLLSEFAAGIDGRGRRWKSAHALLDAQIGPACANAARMNLEMMARLPDAEKGQINYFAKAEADAHAAVANHSWGWSAPKRPPWHKRHAWWLAMVGGAAIYIAGLYSDDVRYGLDELLGRTHSPSSSHPGIESQPSPGTLASPAADR